MPGNTFSRAQQARRHAMFAAARQHGLLRTDLSKRIPIFSSIQQSECWLMFQPLDHLYGAYLYDETHVGILINANHPLNLQRFTAAHEYGHYILEHGPSFDGEEQIQPRNELRNQQELEAQAFAAHFLMPLQLVNTFLKRLGLPITGPQMTSRQIYRLSLELGASYIAVVNHLVTLSKISAATASIHRQKLPKDIKAEIGEGNHPRDSWADVWELKVPDSGHTIYPRIFDEIHIRLPKNDNVGFGWTIIEPETMVTASNFTGNEPLVLVLDEFEQPLLSAPLHHFVFRVLRPGQFHIRLALTPPHLPTTAQTDVFEIRLEALEHLYSASKQGLSEQQKRLL